MPKADYELFQAHVFMKMYLDTLNPMMRAQVLVLIDRTKEAFERSKADMAHDRAEAEAAKNGGV